MFNLIKFLVTMTLLFLTACGDSGDDQCDTSGEYPNNSARMHSIFLLEEYKLQTKVTEIYNNNDCRNEVGYICSDRCQFREDVQQCMNRCYNAENNNCDILQNFEVMKAINLFVNKVNHLPLTTCGAKVVEVGLYHYELITDDTDGDGLSNGWEIVLGLDPCNQYSVGADQCLTDGELDSDGDGIPNKQDSLPNCSGICI